VDDPVKGLQGKRPTYCAWDCFSNRFAAENLIPAIHP